MGPDSSIAADSIDSMANRMVPKTKIPFLCDVGVADSHGGPILGTFNQLKVEFARSGY